MHLPRLSILPMLCFCCGLLASFAAYGGGFRDQLALHQSDHILLDQNWSEEDRQWFYHKTQGSRLMLYDLFLHLEQADNRTLLRDPLNILGFGLIPGKKGRYNPDGLPIGFSRDRNYVGLTCAACHTQLIKYDNQFIRIDGGQAMLNLPEFLQAIQGSLQATLDLPAKFDRFTQALLGKHATPAMRQKMRQKLQAAHAERVDYQRRNHTPVEYGHSRLDAFGAILNKGLQLTGIKDNFNSPDAPTSLPYLWDTPQHDYVEWDGSQSNSKAGALARNVGEAIGVFAHVEPTPRKLLFFWKGGYRSSVNAKGLRQMEEKITTLHSPLWPEQFPAVDQVLAQEGRRLYADYCLSCHQDIERTDPKRLIKVRMSSIEAIGTDPVMARNVLEKRGASGIFAGMPRFYFTGDTLQQEAPALFVANVLMVGILLNNPLQTQLAIRDARRRGHPDEVHPPKYLDGKILERGQEVSDRALLAYKARPLNGVWSSAPFLHNGSVPTLYDLLLPADKRPVQFHIGSWEYDPVKVGYLSDYQPGATFIDTRQKGNSNAGHEYGTGYDGLPELTDADRWALVEYMKTL